MHLLSTPISFICTSARRNHPLERGEGVIHFGSAPALDEGVGGLTNGLLGGFVGVVDLGRRRAGGGFLYGRWDWDRDRGCRGFPALARRLEFGLRSRGFHLDDFA